MNGPVDGGRGTAPDGGRDATPDGGRDAAQDGGARGSVSVDLEVTDERTTIDVTGQRRVAVVVRSPDGEHVYLPPEPTDDGDDGEASPYRPTGANPYEGIADDSPYGSSRRAPASVGRTPTADGFRIVHPEPVTDFRVLR